MINTAKIWLITGVSGGFGRAIAEEVARNGDIVFGTLRKTAQIEEFNKLVPGNTFGLDLDVNDHHRIPLILPTMRTHKSGHIIQISSMAGLRSNPGLSLYNASKYALEGFSEALALETEHLNIKVTIVEPGPFRTDWAGSSSVRSKKIMPEYAETAGSRIDHINSYSGNQPGDPVKGAKAILKAVKSEHPPLRLILGKPALDGVRDKLKSLEKNFADWEEVTLDTSFE